MSAQRIRRTDDGSAWNERERAIGDPVVLADTLGCCLELLTAREMSPTGNWPEPVVADECREHSEHRDRHGPTADPLGPEDSGDHERRDQARGVVKVDRGLGCRRREEIDRKLRERRDQNERREQAQAGEGRDELEEVMQVARAECGFRDPQGMGHGRLQDAARRTADLAVAPVEVRLRARVVVRDHDGDGNGRPDPCHGRDDRAGSPSSSPERVPDPEAGDDEGDLLLAGCRCDREQCERNQPVLVEVPEREEQEAGRECDRVKLVERQPAGRWVQEVREGEAEPSTRGAQVLAREEEDRERAERDHQRLHDEQQLRAGPEPPQRSEEHEDRVDVRGQPGNLVAVQVRHPQRMPVRRRPDGLHHVP